MIYQILKWIFSYAVRTYFREIQIKNADQIPVSGPFILLPNHRSAFMDPIVAGVFLRRKVHFLARGESFNNPVIARLFNWLSMIPVYRKQFSPEEFHKNEEIFGRCFDLLDRGGALMIFPEGLSQTKPRLIPLKTGAARIALGAEARRNFGLGVKLVPLGINYTNPHRFQGKLFLHFGEAIDASQFKDAYEKDPVETVRMLTGKIESDLKSRIIIMEDRRWSGLIDRVQTLIQAKPLEFNVTAKPTEEAAGWYLAKQDIIRTVKFFKEWNPGLLEEMEVRTAEYFRSLEILKVKKTILNPFGKKRSRFMTLGVLLYFIFGLPIFLLGFVLHILPFKINGSLSRMITKRPDFLGSVQLSLGVLVFTVFGILEAWLLARFFHNALAGVLFFLLFPLIGLFAFGYWVRMGSLIQDFKNLKLGRKDNRAIHSLVKERDELILLFKEAFSQFKKNGIGDAGLKVQAGGS